jgi:membrane-associated phospholipid phosphatase
MARLPIGTISDQVLLRSGCCLLLGFLVLTAVVVQDRLVGVDHATRSLVRQSHGPTLLGFMEGASYLGGQPGQVALLVVGVVILWPRQRWWAVALPLVMAGAGVLQLAAKWSVDRPRPNLDPLGFPSAHVLSLVVLCGYLAYAVSVGRARRRRRHLVSVACAGAVGTVGYSRIYLDAHWLSDVLGGLTVGLAYLLLAIWLVRATPRLVRAWWRGPLGRGAEVVLAPAPVGPAGEAAAGSLATAAGASAMAPPAPTRSVG